MAIPRFVTVSALGDERLAHASIGVALSAPFTVLITFISETLPALTFSSVILFLVPDKIQRDKNEERHRVASTPS